MINDDFNDSARSLALGCLLPNLLRNAARTLTFIYTQIMLKRLLRIVGVWLQKERRMKIKTGTARSGMTEYRCI